MTNNYYGYAKEIHQASEIYIKNEIIVRTYKISQYIFVREK